jgi:hippurate hydrolase
MSENEIATVSGRRDFLKLAGAGTALAGATLVAGQGSAAATANTTDGTGADVTAKISPELAGKLANSVGTQEPELVALFKQIHENPEPAFMEVETAKIVADELTRLGYEVHTGIAKTGVAAVLRNGEGPVVMFRADMDALPIKEQTDLLYASTKIQHDRSGVEVPVMHACGHDAHTVWLFGMARQMVEFKDQWSGTLILIAQPAEETIEGAAAMVEDGLYDLVPKPDLVIAGHTHPVVPAGFVAIAAGDRMAGTDQIDVKIYGVGGHGSQPSSTKDPVVMSAMAIMAYQAIVSRVVDQYHPAVLTVGAIQSGSSANIIPDEATLLVNLRWYSENVRETMVSGIRSVTDNIANMYNMPPDRMPEYIFNGHSGPLVNREDDAERARAAMELALGKDKVMQGFPPVMGSEDFQNLISGLPDARSLFVEIGAGKPEVFENAKKGILPEVLNHNPRYVIEPGSVATGTLALSAVVMEFLGNG